VTLLAGETANPFHYGTNVVTYTTDLTPATILERYAQLLAEQGWGLAEERPAEGYQRHVNGEPDQPIAPDMITLELQIVRRSAGSTVFEVRTYREEGE
jgi:hypothetical protein